MSARPRRRSHEPVVWLLFAAGGMAAAMLLPALIVVIGLAGPIGLLSDGSLDYERVSGLVGHPLGRLMVFAVLSLLFWHAMHRIFHGLHDIGIETRGKPYRVITYGSAALATLVTAGLVLML
jgi:fumarate reductase subunit D